MPSYAKKEILLVNASITNCDPDNIFETIEVLKQSKIKVSVVSLSASMHVLQKLSQETGGQMFLAKDQQHYLEILEKYLVPQETSAQIENSKAQLIKIAFPSVKMSKNPVLCNCHNEYVYQYVSCPNCKANLCLLSRTNAEAEGREHNSC